MASTSDSDKLLDLPWIQALSASSEYTQISLPEWDDVQYRQQNGWHGSDLVHGIDAAVRVVKYYYNIDAQRLVGICHFTRRAESHKGLCHGGSMCMIMDDVLGWLGMLAANSESPPRSTTSDASPTTTTTTATLGATTSSPSPAMAVGLAMQRAASWNCFTAQIDTSLRAPIAVDSILKIEAWPVSIEGRKVWAEAKLVNGDTGLVHAQGKGLILRKRDS
jgi:acyl-coenzyme A thioesterase PaaI-like protein